MKTNTKISQLELSEVPVATIAIALFGPATHRSNSPRTDGKGGIQDCAATHSSLQFAVFHRPDEQALRTTYKYVALTHTTAASTAYVRAMRRFSSL